MRRARDHSRKSWVTGARCDRFAAELWEGEDEEEDDDDDESEKSAGFRRREAADDGATRARVSADPRLLLPLSRGSSRRRAFSRARRGGCIVRARYSAISTVMLTRTRVVDVMGLARFWVGGSSREREDRLEELIMVVVGTAR